MPSPTTPRKISYSRTLAYVAAMAAAAGAYAAFVVWIEYNLIHNPDDHPADLHSALSLVLGLLLVFRTNAAYDRWWEARTLWGALVNASRNLTAKVVGLTRVPPDEASRLGELVVAFPPALRDHLRREPVKGIQPELAAAADAVGHTPGMIVRRVYTMLGVWKANAWIDGDELRVLDREAAKLLDICGGCERILSTRIARSYRRFARQCVVLFLFTLPWGIVDAFGWWTAPLTIVVSYFMIGLEVVAEHVEEPFGYDEDDLDLDGMCDTIDRTVRELLDPPTTSLPGPGATA